MYGRDIKSAGTSKVQGQFNINTTLKPACEFPSQQHENIGRVNSSPKVSSDQPEKFSVVKLL